MRKIFTAQKWQTDPNKLDTPKIQYWTYQGTLLTAMMPIDEARRLVTVGQAFIITGQAISQMPK